jgi:Rieske Fe-S protein
LAEKGCFFEVFVRLRCTKTSKKPLIPYSRYSLLLFSFLSRKSDNNHSFLVSDVLISRCAFILKLGSPGTAKNGDNCDPGTRRKWIFAKEEALMDDSNEINRRQFVKVVAVSVGTVITAAIGLPAVAYVMHPASTTQATDSWIPLGPLEEYPIGEPTLFNFTRTVVNGWEKTVNTYGAYVVRYTETDYKVFSNTCTHLSCRVNWRNPEADFHCPCHDGIFDIEGKVVSGPPPRPLYEYETKIEDGIVYIHLLEA